MATDKAVLSRSYRAAARSGVCVALMACAAVACTSKPANPIPPIQSKSAAQLCAESNYDPNVIVYRDSSSQYRLAAVGVTAHGNLKDFGAAVGPSIITSRGGATVTGGSDIDTEARSCDTYKQPTP